MYVHNPVQVAGGDVMFDPFFLKGQGYPIHHVVRCLFLRW